MEKDELENQDSELTNNSMPESDNNEPQAEPEQQPSSKTQQAASLITDLVRLWKMLPMSVKGLIASILGYVLLFVGIVILIVLVAASTAGVAQELKDNITDISETVSEIGEKVGNFFTGAGFVTNQEEAEKNEKKYFEKLKEVSDYYQNNYNVKIDTTLITATLFYGRGMSDYIDAGDINTLEDQMSDDDIYQGEADFYKLARRQIKTLAKFQIVENVSYNNCVEGDQAQTKIEPESEKEIADNWTGIFGWNQRSTHNYQPYEIKSYPMIDGTEREITWCEYQSAKLLLESHYKDDYEIYNNAKREYDNCVSECKKDNCTTTTTGENGITYTTPIPDCTACDTEQKCKTKKSTMDNYYQKLQDNWGDIFDEDGIFLCQNSDEWGNLGSYDNGCSAKDPVTTNYTTNIGREGVYYYKLLSRNQNLLGNKNFIEKYYPDYVSDTGDDVAMEDAIEVVEGIYDLYDFIAENNLFASYLSSNLCPNGITVIPGTNDSGHNKDPQNYPIGTFDLEEYVAMVLNGENNSGYDEAMKAQIIAARTYTIARTDGCTRPIRNSTEDQVARANPSDHLKELVNETAGMVLTYNGEVFSSEYDSFKGDCSGSSCSGVYTKLPAGEKHTVTIPSNFSEGIGGHGRGMSQCAANYLASTGKSYEEILKYFYSSGVEIAQSIGGGSDQYPNVTYDHFDGNVLVSWARNYIGNSYVFGGTSLTHGTDCSGFVQSLVKSLFNISLPRTSRQQVNVGTSVSSLDQARPGDLLFYTRAWAGGDIGHVAIYSGNGMQVHAVSEEYGIMESPVNETPVAIRRIGG